MADDPTAFQEMMERSIAHSLQNDALKNGGRTSSCVHGMSRETLERVIGYVQETGFRCRACFGGSTRIEVVAPHLGAGVMPQMPVPAPTVQPEKFHRPQTPSEEFIDQAVPGPKRWDPRVEEAIAIEMARAAAQQGHASLEFFGFNEDALDNIRGILARSNLMVITRKDRGTILACEQNRPT